MIYITMTHKIDATWNQLLDWYNHTMTKFAGIMSCSDAPATKFALFTTETNTLITAFEKKKGEVECHDKKKDIAIMVEKLNELIRKVGIIAPRTEFTAAPVPASVDTYEEAPPPLPMNDDVIPALVGGASRRKRGSTTKKPSKTSAKKPSKTPVKKPSKTPAKKPSLRSGHNHKKLKYTSI